MANARAATTDLKQLQSLLSGIGVTAKIVDDKVVVENQGKFASEIDFNLSEDKSVIGVSTSFEAISPEKRAIVPFADLLNANSAGEWARFPFGLCRTSDAEWICIGTNFEVAALNKKSLRTLLDDLTVRIDSNEPLWNAAKWVAPPVSGQDAKAAADAAWEANPLQIENAMFVTSKAPGYGMFEKRSTNVFKPGEDLITYVEPKNFRWKEEGANGYSIGLVVDAALLNDKGEVIYEKLNSMGPLGYVSHDRVREWDVNMTFTLSGAPAGDYTLRYTFHDANGPKTAVISLPFKIAG
jgi:hypothetical protein